MPVSAGSTPAEGTIAGEARQDEHPPCKREAAGSSPATGSLANAARTVRAPLSYGGGCRFESDRWLSGDAQVCSAVLQTAPARFDTEVVHSARMAKLEKAPGPEPGFLGVRLPVRVRMSAGCGSAWSEHSVRIRGVARSNRANPTQGAVDEVGRVARLSPGTRCGFEARPRHGKWALGKLSRRRHARVAQLEERRSYTPEVGGSKPSAGTHDDGGCSSPARAPGRGPGGSGLDPRQSPQGDAPT